MKVKYIHNEENETLKKHINYLEIQLLTAILKKDYHNSLKYINTLLQFYENNSDYKIISILIYKVFEFINDEKKISKRVFNSVKGNVYDIFNMFLLNEDYYRLYELVNNYFSYDEENEIDIKKMCYASLTEAIINLNEHNLLKVKKDILIKSYNNNTEILKDYIIPSLDLELLKNMEEKITVDFDIDYYSEYLEQYNNHNYKEAYKMIRMHYIQTKELNEPANISYIINELEMLLRFDNGEYSIYIDKAKKAYDEKKYKLAILYYDKALKIIPNMRLYALKAKCYREVGDIESAYQCYSLAEFYMSPEEMEECIYFLYGLKRWDDIILIYNNYYDYVNDNLKLMYMCSVASLQMGLFEEAGDFLEVCEIYANDIQNKNVNFNYEKKIIEDLENNKNVFPYDLEVFDMHFLTEDELLLKEYIEKNMIEDNNLEDREVEYLLTLVKIYLEIKEYQKAKRILSLVKIKINNIKDVKYQKTLKKYSSFYSSFIL